jgi:hydroxymethylpyrimidine/phosphomethylpyrimidine kinase
MYAKNGAPLIETDAVNTLIKEVVPLGDLITPNISEAEKMSRMTIKTHDDMREAARSIFAMGCRAVIVKGGHFDSNADDATDILFDGSTFYEYPSPRIKTKHTHGTGCTFSSAIASNLALRFPLHKAVESAKAYINTAITHAPGLGKGNGPTHHFYALYENYFKEK